MHRELRAWNSEIPESAERIDPILRILLQLYAGQIEHIDKRIDHVWEVATSSLIRSLCPEGIRWPVPAFTVMRCQPTDPIVDIDPHIRFFYKEKREGGQTLFFSPIRHERLIAAKVRHIFLAVDNTVIDFSPIDENAPSSSRPRPSFTSGNSYKIYLGIDHNGPSSDFAKALLFLVGQSDLLKQLHWAYWYPSSHFGGFHEDSGFCPGLTSFEDMFAGTGQTAEWGGLRTGANLFKPLENNFISLPEKFTLTWEMGPPDPKLAELLKRNDISLPSDTGNIYWVRLDLPAGGDKAKLQSSFEAYLDCFIAVNKTELTLFKHTGGNRLVEVELPESIDRILEVTSVVDSGGKEYVAKHKVGVDRSHRFYSPEERGNKLVLWFDFSSQLELPPDSLTVSYAITAGVDANGIEIGKITDLYENHPGITSAYNLIPTAGAIPAKTDEQILTEVSARLRNRDRSLSFPEISRWAMTFDPRIKKASCENGVERAERGVRRCIVLKAAVTKTQFHSEDEVNLLRSRLGSFLKARSPINTHYRVEIIKE